MQPDRRITAFIRRHHVMTLATGSGDRPWCSNAFYAYMEAQNAFVITANPNTRHGAEMEANPMVAGSIVLESRIVGNLQGVQFEALVYPAPEHPLKEEARAAYLKRFPYAVFADLDLWIVAPTHLKLTDNRLGFGKKLIWKE